MISTAAESKLTLRDVAQILIYFVSITATVAFFVMATFQTKADASRDVQAATDRSNRQSDRMTRIEQAITQFSAAQAEADKKLSNMDGKLELLIRRAR